MWIDPIIKEVRDAGEEMAKKANYDLYTFSQNLLDNEKQRNPEIVSRDTPVDELKQ